jgi:peptidyl-dipeptidase Dcp
MKARFYANTALAALMLTTLPACATIDNAGDTAMNDIPPMDAMPDYSNVPQGTGYFASESTLPLQAPDFNAFTDADFRPALEQAMAIHQAEVAAITANPAPATFANTIVALEDSGAMLSRVLSVFGQMVGANTNDTLDAIDAEFSPRLAAHSDAIMLNDALFARVKAVYDNRAAMAMTVDDAALLEETYKSFVHAGAMLSDADKAKVKAINAELSTLSTEFSQKLTQATADNALVVDDAAALAGLSPSEVQQAAKRAADKGMDGKYLLPLINTTQQPDLVALSNRATRQALFERSFHRTDRGGENDTRANLARQAQLRAQKAVVLGEPSWAAYQMYDNMASGPAEALGFMAKLVPATAATQRREAGVLNEMIAETGGNFTVKPWDWDRYAEMVRKARYDLDENATKPYFEVNRVLEDGVFFAANKLYGLSFRKRTDLPVYHPDVTTYDVMDADGSMLGLFYFDPFARANKQGGAWMGNFVEQSKRDGTLPVIYNTLNIAPPADGEPALATFDNVTTLFHEFGHALHGLFADQQYASISGTNVARDFVEYPSQVNEMWATDPAILSNYAKHYQTGEPIPAELIEKIERASKFNQGYALGETLTAALLDMKWHSLTPAEAAAIDTPEKVDAFEAKALADLGLETDLVPPRYRSSYFRHIFAGGYSAGYYAYLWTEMLDRDSRQWFTENGGLTRANGDHFRKTVLSTGATQDYAAMYRAFAGRDPQIDAMLEARGLIGGDAPEGPANADETG